MEVTMKSPTGTQLGFVTRSCCGPDGTGECQSKKAGFPCGIGEVPTWDEPTSEEQARADMLRILRRRKNLTLREAAYRVGVSLVEFSALERGTATVDDWDKLMSLLEGTQ